MLYTHVRGCISVAIPEWYEGTKLVLRTGEGGNMIRVLVVDDHDFVREMVTRVLTAADGIQVVGECCDGAEVPAMARSTSPDVVLMDVRMPVRSGIDATSELMNTHPATRVVMLTGSVNPRIVAESAHAGAVGFLVKGVDKEHLIHAVRTVAAGGTAWPSDPLFAGR